VSVCTTCLQPDLPADSQHDCPGLGDIQLTRQLGRGVVVETAPQRARIALTLLTDSSSMLAMRSVDQISIADQVLYRVTGYDPEHTALIVELVDDWRTNPSSTGDGVCTATITTHDNRTLHCAQPAGHYDEDRYPEPPGDDDPGGWHQSAPDREDDRMTWSDRATGTTPHKGQP
jgi:hypothetical protein